MFVGFVVVVFSWQYSRSKKKSQPPCPPPQKKKTKGEQVQNIIEWADAHASGSAFCVQTKESSLFY